MPSKKSLLILSGALAGILLATNYTGTSYLCGGRENTGCMQSAASILRNLFPIIPLFLMACIAHFLREETFRAWLKFTYVWIPLTMLGIFMAPEYGSPFLPITKGSIAGISSLLFVLISLGIMLFKSISTQPRK